MSPADDQLLTTDSPPLPQAAELPGSVHRELGRIGARITRQTLVLGIVRLLLCLASAVILSFALDSGLELPRPLRAGVTISCALLLLLAFQRFVLLGLQHRPRQDAIALQVEQMYPELQDRLISAVQLERELRDADAGWNSRQLIGSVLSQAAVQVRRLDLNLVARRERLPRATFMTTMVVAALGFFFFTNPTLASIWFERNLLFKDRPWPRNVEITVTSGSATVIMGESFTVTTNVTRGTPRRVTIDTEFADHVERDRDLVQQGSVYRWTFANVTEPFSYQVRASGAAPSPVFNVDVVVPPRIEEIAFFLDFPGYTRRPSTPSDEPVKHTSLRVPAGTRVRYEATCNKAVTDARLMDLTELAKPSSGQRSKDVAAAVEAALNETRPAPFNAQQPSIDSQGEQSNRIISGEFIAQGPEPKASEEAQSGWSRVRRLALALRSVDGIASRRPTVFEVRVDPDRAPSIDISEPGRAKDVTPNAQVQVTANASDDYGIVSAKLTLSIRSGADGSESDQEHLPFLQVIGEGERETVREFEPGARDMRLRTSIDVGGVGAKAGDRILYQALATDEYPGQRAETAPRRYELRVVSPEELLRILQERLLRLRIELRQLEKLQERGRDLGEAVARNAVGSSQLSRAERKQLYESEIIERKVATRLRLVSKELARIAEERRQNRVGTEEEATWHEEMRDASKRIAERDLPEVMAALEEQRKSPEVDALALRQTAEKQNLILEELRALAGRINRWGDYTEVIREIRDLIGNQEQINSETKSQVKERNK